jgi:4'-phosphopantetheinyl transferase
MTGGADGTSLSLIRPADGEVAIWHAHTADAWADPGRVSRALAWLEPAERARYDRFRHDVDRHMFLLGRAMARRLVGCALDVDPLSWHWREGERGRPEVGRPESRVSFNLAHSAGLVVCAISHEREVGVDVEHRLRPPTDRQIVRRFCAPAEIADIESYGADGWRDRFLRYWTLKEAYLKARGVGIAVPLAEVSFTIAEDRVRVAFLDSLTGLDTTWAFLLAEAGDTHFIAAAAAADDGVEPRFTLAPFPSALLP